MLSWVTILIFTIALAIAQLSSVRAQDSQQPAELKDLRVAQAKPTTVEGKNGIEIRFDGPSADRVRQFTSRAVGRSIIVLVNQRMLAKLRVLDPIEDGNILLTGDFDSEVGEALSSGGAMLDLKIERSDLSR